jgi:hypothetical protein
MTTAPKLYHYTCGHHHPAISRTGILRPGKDLAVTRAQRDALASNPISRSVCQVVWLTELPHIVWLNGAVLGLTNHALLDCDRTRHRYRVTPSAMPVVPWATLREVWPRHVVAALEAVPGVEPATWWASRGPLNAVYDPHQADRLVPA